MAQRMGRQNRPIQIADWPTLWLFEHGGAGNGLRRPTLRQPYGEPGSAIHKILVGSCVQRLTWGLQLRASSGGSSTCGVSAGVMYITAQGNATRSWQSDTSGRHRQRDRQQRPFRHWGPDRLASSIRRLSAADQVGLGPTEPCNGCSSSLLSCRCDACAGYRAAHGIGDSS